MKKKMLIWIGAAALATVAVACSKKNAGTTPVENAPAAAPAGGDAYGGAKYGTPAPEAAPEAAPAPESK
jgi:hypothetical protein